MKLNKSFSILFPLSFSLALLASCNSSSFNVKNVKIYAGSLENVLELKNTIYFSDAKKGIPYIDVEKGVEFFNTLMNNEGDKNFKITYEKSRSIHKYKRENGTTLTFDFDNNAVECDNINLFRSPSYAINEFDCSGVDGHFYDESGKIIEGQTKYITTKKNQVYTTKPKPMYVCLADYNINMVVQSGKYLVPFATYFNIAGPTSASCIFSGESFFIAGQSLSQLGQAYFEEFYKSFAPTSRSKELIEYNYNEFVRDLDYSYGLASEHNISSFYTFFEENGLKDLLMSNSRYNEDKAYMMLQSTYLADRHTGFTSQNAYGGYDAEEARKIKEEIPLNPRLEQIQNKGAERLLARYDDKNIKLEASGSTTALSPIIKTDDTLIITFDHFMATSDKRGIDFYYSDDFKTLDQKQTYINSNPNDTIAIISYANDLIHEDLKLDNPTIKNVVIDLSGNGGGIAHTALFTLAWLDSALMQLVDPINGNQGATAFTADVNFDKKIDGDDFLLFSNPGEKIAWGNEHKIFAGNVYCVTSESSFSCGNFVPAMLKQSGLVKLIGTKSGGGACIVRVSSTADGSGFCFSGNKKLCRSQNGSFYSIDEGIEPDYLLDNYDTLYKGNQDAGQPSNRKNLVTYINNLK